MSPRLWRLTGITLVLTAIAAGLGSTLGDPLIESHDDRETFVEQVENAADRVPVIYIFQVVEVGRGFLAVAAGLGLYLVLRERARGTSVGGLLLFVFSGILVTGQALVGAGMARAADDYAGGGLVGIGTGSADVLELIRILSVLHFGYSLRRLPRSDSGPLLSHSASPGLPASHRVGWGGSGSSRAGCSCSPRWP